MVVRLGKAVTGQQTETLHGVIENTETAGALESTCGLLTLVCLHLPDLGRERRAEGLTRLSGCGTRSLGSRRGRCMG